MTMQVELANILGWSLTLVLSIMGAWAAMNARLYEVEAKIRLLEAQTIRDAKRSDIIYDDVKRHLEDSIKVTESLIRIEGALKLKADKKFKE
jgi:hypothetical protein